MITIILIIINFSIILFKLNKIYDRLEELESFKLKSEMEMSYLISEHEKTLYNSNDIPLDIPIDNSKKEELEKRIERLENNFYKK